jgi:uncharacterized protein YbaR (Trm112 family)
MTTDRVHCPQCSLDYPIENGIPIMLIEQARLSRDFAVESEKLSFLQNG